MCSRCPALRRVIVETASPEGTEAAGADLAAGLNAGDVVLVSGELGAGRPRIRGACRALGVEDRSTSPTFTIGQVYGGRIEVASRPLPARRARAGAPRGLPDPERIAFIEWPETGAIERPAAQVKLDHLGGDRRRIEVS